MNCHYHKSKKWYHYVSMELFIEFTINFYYFVSYCEVFIYELSSIKHVWNVLEIVFLHLLSESCQSIIRFSAFYFDLKKKIYTRTQFYDNNNNNSGVTLLDATTDYTTFSIVFKSNYIYPCVELVILIAFMFIIVLTMQTTIITPKIVNSDTTKIM